MEGKKSELLQAILESIDKVNSLDYYFQTGKSNLIINNTVPFYCKGLLSFFCHTSFMVCLLSFDTS